MPVIHSSEKSWPDEEFLEELLAAHPPPGWQVKPSKQHQPSQQVAWKNDEYLKEEKRSEKEKNMNTNDNQTEVQ